MLGGESQFFVKYLIRSRVAEMIQTINLAFAAYHLQQGRGQTGRQPEYRPTRQGITASRYDCGWSRKSPIEGTETIWTRTP